MTADDERRGSARRRSLKGAKAVLPTGGVIDVVVRDLSDTGAKLQVGNALSLPDTFELRLEGSAPMRVKVVWRKAREIGVTFNAKQSE